MKIVTGREKIQEYHQGFCLFFSVLLYSVGTSRKGNFLFIEMGEGRTDFEGRSGVYFWIC